MLVNEAYVIVGDLGYDKTGPVTKVTEVLGHDRLRVGSEHGVQSTVLQRSDLLMKEKLKAGDEVRVDANLQDCLSRCWRARIRTNTISTPCRNCRGKKSAASARRSWRSAMRSSCPCCTRICLHAFSTRRRRDFSFTGPPGCGKGPSSWQGHCL